MTRNRIQLDPQEWNGFTKFAHTQGISLDSEEDWGPWWDCWKSGYDQGEDDYMEHCRDLGGDSDYD